MTFTAQEEKLFEEEFPDITHTSCANKSIRCGTMMEDVKSFLRSHDQRLIDYLLEKWPEKREELNVNDINESIPPGKMMDDLSNVGFNSALQQTRKLLEDYKK